MWEALFSRFEKSIGTKFENVFFLIIYILFMSFVTINNFEKECYTAYTAILIIVVLSRYYILHRLPFNNTSKIGVIMVSKKQVNIDLTTAHRKVLMSSLSGVMTDDYFFYFANGNNLKKFEKLRNKPDDFGVYLFEKKYSLIIYIDEISTGNQELSYVISPNLFTLQLIKEFSNFDVIQKDINNIFNKPIILKSNLDLDHANFQAKIFEIKISYLSMVVFLISGDTVKCVNILEKIKRDVKYLENHFNFRQPKSIGYMLGRLHVVYYDISLQLSNKYYNDVDLYSSKHKLSEYMILLEYSNKNLKNSINEFDKGITRKEIRYHYLIQEGIYHYFNGNYQQGLNVIQNAKEIMPENLLHNYSKAFLLAVCSNFDEAIIIYESMRKIKDVPYYSMIKFTCREFNHNGNENLLLVSGYMNYKFGDKELGVKELHRFINSSVKISDEAKNKILKIIELNKVL